MINVFEASDIFRELHCSYLGQPLQTLVLGSENKLNYEHLRIFLIHTGNKIALQFHKINVPVYIYRKTDCTYPQRSIRKNERERLREDRREKVWNKNRKTSQKPYRQYSAQLSRHNCTSKRVTAQCWGQEGPKSSTFTMESSGTNRAFTVKSIAGKQTDALLLSAAEHPSHTSACMCVWTETCRCRRLIGYWTCVSKLPLSWPSS